VPIPLYRSLGLRRRICSSPIAVRTAGGFWMRFVETTDSASLFTGSPANATYSSSPAAILVAGKEGVLVNVVVVSGQHGC
jgi:hypothetical protein